MSAPSQTGLLPRTFDPDAGAGAAASSALASGTFVTATSQPQLPLSRELDAGARIDITDNGAQGTIEVAVDGVTDTLLTDLDAASILTATASSLTNARNVTVGGSLTFTDGGAGGTYNIADGYTSATFATTTSGAFVAATTLSLTRIQDQVVVRFPALTGTSTGGSLVITAGGAFPAAWRPAASSSFLVPGRNAGVNAVVVVSWDAGAELWLATPFPTAGFTGGLSAGWPEDVSVAYQRAF